MDNIFPDLTKPHKTPFIFEAFGFYFPFEESEGPESHKGINQGQLLPCPLPDQNYIGLSWVDWHLRDRQYNLFYHSQHSPPWSGRKVTKFPKIKYPARDDGTVETWSFKGFRYVAGCHQHQIMETHDHILAGTGPWMDLSTLIRTKIDEGAIHPDVMEEWEKLQIPYSSRSSHLYWERKRVNDAILIALAMDYRWGFPCVNSILKDLCTREIVLVYMGFFLTVRIVDNVDFDLGTEVPLFKEKVRTRARKLFPAHVR